MNYSYLPTEKYTSTPPDGFCQVLRDRWWQVHPEKGLAIYRGPDRRFFSPQCNQNRALVEKMPAELEVRFLEFVWLPHDCQDYV